MNTHLTLADVKISLKELKKPEGDFKWSRLDRLLLPVGIATMVSVGIVASLIFDRFCGSKIMAMPPPFASIDSRHWREVKLVLRSLGSIIAFITGVGGSVIGSVVRAVIFYFYKDFFKIQNELKGLDEFQREMPLKGNSLQKVLSLRTDETFRQQLIDKMDLEQLGEARSNLGTKQFNRLIQKSSAPNVNLWKDLEKIAFSSDRQGILKNLEKLQAFKEKIWYPALLRQIDKEMQDRKVYDVIRPQLLKMAPVLDLVKIEFNDPTLPPIIIKQDVAQQLSGPLLPVAFKLLQWRNHGKVVDKKRGGKIYLHPQQAPFPSVRGTQEFFTPSRYHSFKRIVEGLNGEKVTCSFEEILDDLRFADMWMSSEVFNVVESDLFRYPIPETYQSYQKVGEIYQIVISSPGKDYFLKKMETVFNSTIHTREETDLLIPVEDKSLVIQKFNDSPSPNLLAVLYRYCDEKEFTDLFTGAKDKLINGKYFKSLLHHFTTYKDAKGAVVVRACNEYQKSLSVADKLMGVI